MLGGPVPKRGDPLGPLWEPQKHEYELIRSYDMYTSSASATSSASVQTLKRLRRQHLISEGSMVECVCMIACFLNNCFYFWKRFDWSTVWVLMALAYWAM